MCNHLLNPHKYWVLKRDRRPQLAQLVTFSGVVPSLLKDQCLRANKPGLVAPCAFPSTDRTGGPLAYWCSEVLIVGEMIPILLRVLCTKRSDSSSPQSGSAPKGLHSRRVAAGHRARPESPRGRTCKAPGRAQAPSGSATRLPGADRGAPAP